MSFDEYVDEQVQKLDDVIALIIAEEYHTACTMLTKVYQDLQQHFPKNIPAVYIKQDRIGYQQWMQDDAKALGDKIQHLLLYLDKQKCIDSNTVVAYIEGAGQMATQYGLPITDEQHMMLALHGIIYAYTA